MSAPRYVHFRAGGYGFPGILPLLDAAERGKRDGSIDVLGARRIGDSLGYEAIGRLVRKGGAVEFEGLDPDDGPEEGGPS